MNNRQMRKAYRNGTLITIKGTSCVFMSLGHKAGTKNEINSFNGMDIRLRMPVRRCDGTARLATKREQAAYWNVLKEFIAREADKKELRKVMIHEVNLKED